MTSLRRSFSFRSAAICGGIVVAIDNAIDEHPDGAGSEIETWRRLIDNDSDQLDDGLIGMVGAQEEIAAIDLIEHGTLARSGEGDVAAGLHCGDHDGGTVFADPEAGRWGLGHLAINLRQGEAACGGELLTEDTHDVGVALTCELDYGTEGFQ